MQTKSVLVLRTENRKHDISSTHTTSASSLCYHCSGEINGMQRASERSVNHGRLRLKTENSEMFPPDDAYEFTFFLRSSRRNNLLPSQVAEVDERFFVFLRVQKIPEIFPPDR